MSTITETPKNETAIARVFESEPGSIGIFVDEHDRATGAWFLDGDVSLSTTASGQDCDWVPDTPSSPLDWLFGDSADPSNKFVRRLDITGGGPRGPIGDELIDGLFDAYSEYVRETAADSEAIATAFSAIIDGIRAKAVYEAIGTIGGIKARATREAISSVSEQL